MDDIVDDARDATSSKPLRKLGFLTIGLFDEAFTPSMGLGMLLTATGVALVVRAPSRPV